MVYTFWEGRISNLTLCLGNSKKKLSFVSYHLLFHFIYLKTKMTFVKNLGKETKKMLV